MSDIVFSIPSGIFLRVSLSNFHFGSSGIRFFCLRVWWCQGVSYLISTGLERLEWSETTRGRSFHSKLFVSILNFQANEQTTRTENNLTDFCGGTVQPDPKTEVPSRGQRVLLTQRMTACKYSARQALEQAVPAIQVAPSGKV